MKEIPIALCGDKNVLPYMSTVICSAALNMNKDSSYIFYCLISGDCTKEQRELLLQSAKNSVGCAAIEIIDMGDKFSDINLGWYITFPAYYRLLLPSLLPQHDKIIYLDTDVLVFKDLSELFEIDIKENYISGVPVSITHLNKKVRKLTLNSGFSSADYYINSGVLLMNLSTMRRDGIQEKCVAKIMDPVLCKIETGDQVILNFICCPHIGFLPSKWNMDKSKVQSYNGYIRKFDIFECPKELDDAYGDPAIYHWAGPKKPWKFYDIPLAHKWFRYFCETSFTTPPPRVSCIGNGIKGKIKETIRTFISIWRNGNV